MNNTVAEHIEYTTSISVKKEPTERLPNSFKKAPTYAVEILHLAKLGVKQKNFYSERNSELSKLNLCDPCGKTE